jgi:hypothetical protein
MASLFQIRRGESLTGSLASGEVYYDIESQSLALGTDIGTNVQLAKIGGINSGSFELTGNLIVSGNTTIVGNLQFGSTSSVQDTVTLLSEVSSSIIPYNDLTWSLGTETKRWNNIYANIVSASAFTGSFAGIGNLEIFSQSVDLRLDNVEFTSSNNESRVDLLENAMSGSKRLYVSPNGDDNTTDGTKEYTPFKTIKAAVESLGSAVYTNVKRYTIFVGSGEYTEQNPIVVPPGVSIVGDTLRTVRLTAANPTKDFFHVHDSNYFYGLRFLDLKNPAFAFSFPASTANATISGGNISNISVVHSLSGYTNGTNQDLGIIIEGPDNSGSIATATADVVGGVITQINVVNAGTNYSATEKPHISIPAPVGQRPVITTSPYVQNCSSITGPFNTSGVKVLQQLPYDIVAFDIDEQGAGGGIRIDGNLVHPLSPLESFVADAFTQVNQGGPGHLVINKGYAQFVSCFTTFCTYGFKVANGGFANISNSVIDFGKEGLVAKTYYPTTYNSGSSLETKTSTVNGFVLDENGAGYTGSTVVVTISGGGASVDATAEATVNANGSIDEIVLLTSGSGYIFEPTVTIAAPSEVGGIQATTVANKAKISGVTEFLINLGQDALRGVDISSNMILSGSNYLVTGVQSVVGQPSQRRITTYPAPPSITTGDAIAFHQLSNISTGGLVMEYVGSGVTYNALPKFGGVPIRTREIIEFAPGRVFYSTVDNIGNLKIGDFFAVNQLTGEVTIDANSFNLSGLNAIGPFRRNGVAAGVVLQEVSNNTTLLNSQGLFGEDTVPTQYAVKEYIGVISTSFDDRTDKLEATASNHETRIDNLELISASYNAYTQSTNQFTASVTQSLDSIYSYTSSLKAAFNVSGSGINSLTTIYGDLRVEGTQSIINSENLAVKDNLIYLNDSSSITNPDLGIVGNYNDGTYAHTGIFRDSFDGVWKVFKGYTTEPSGNIDISDPSYQYADFYANEISASINGIGRVGAYSASVDSRLVKLESTGSNFDSRLDSIETYTASVSTSVGLLQTFSSSQYKTDSSSFDSRIDSIESNTGSYVTISDLNSSSSVLQSNINAKLTTSTFNAYTTSANSRINALELTSQSLNSYTASVSTSVGLLQEFSGSEYKNDSGSFDTRISASTLTFNDTSNQIGIDFTKVGTQVSATVSGLTTSSNVQFASITASNNISSSGTVYCDTLVATTLVGATLPVLEYETNGTLGNILIKGATSKSIQVVDSIKFTGLSQNGADQYSATGLQLTGSLHVTSDITASGNLFISGTIYATELHTIIQSSSVIFSSGSNQIGDQQSDVLTITGSLNQTGSTLFSELSGSLFAFSSSLNSRLNTGGGNTTTLSSSIYQTDATQSNNISINSASAWGAFQSASAYSASAASALNSLSSSLAGNSTLSASVYEVNATQSANITTVSASAWGAFQSASSYSSSLASRLAIEEFKSTTFATTGSNTFNGNQIISGSLSVTGDVVAYSTSDERLKDNIQLISNPIEKVNQLRGVEFDWKDGLPKAGQHEYGVIAQDVLKVMPELVNQRQDGYYAVDYDKIVGLLIEVVKEQEKRIKELENKIG